MSPLSVTLPRLMRVLILGGDGYLGWPTALRFSARGHEVAVVDNFSRRRWVGEGGSDSLTPIGSLEQRIEAWRETSGEQIRSYAGSVEDGDFLDGVVAETRPEVVIHYGEQPSAPFSMISRKHGRSDATTARPAAIASSATWRPVAVRLGTRFCRTLSGQARPGLTRAEGVARTVDGLRRSLDYAERRDVVLCMENHYKDGTWQYPEFAQPEDVFLEILDRVESPRLGVQYDPSNAVVGGYDPIRFLERVLPRVVTMHASDRSLAPGATIEDLPAGLRREDTALTEAALAALRRIFGRRIGKRPMVEVHLIRI